MKAVLYTDGSSRPNPGYTGWGAHGYLYEDKETKKSYCQHSDLTEFGYTPKDKKTNSVSVIEFFDYLGNTGYGTNNISEINSMYYSLSELEKKELTHIQIYTDSEYVRRGILEWSRGWIARNWVKEDGSDVINKVEWIRLLDIISSLKNSGVEIKIEWVKGHSANVGNQVADYLATIAMHYNRIENKVFEDYRYFQPDEYWKQTEEKHPYVALKRMIFNSGSAPTRSKDTLPIYYFEDSDKEEKYIGKKFNKTSYNAVMLFEPIDVLEAIKQRQFDVSSGVQSTIMARLEKIFEPETYRYIQRYGGYTLNQQKNYDLSLVFLDNKPVTVEITPPRLVLRAVESLSHLGSILTTIHTLLKNNVDSKLEDANTNDVIWINITDHFYKTEEIGKNRKQQTTLLPTIKNGIKDLVIPFTIPTNSTKTISNHVALELGNDILPRNNLKKLEGYHPEVYLLLLKETDVAFKFMTLVKSDLGFSIWSNYCADQIFLSSSGV